MEKCFLRNHFDKTASQNAGISDAREVKGKTKSFSPNLVVSAVATDGSSVTVPVTVVRTVRLLQAKFAHQKAFRAYLIL